MNTFLIFFTLLSLFHVNSIIARRDRFLSTSEKTDCHTLLKSTTKGKFVRDFEPRPTISSYEGDTNPTTANSFVKDFEPRPTISSYGGDETDNTHLKTANSFVKTFEPRPTISSYGGDMDKSLTKNFEPRPTISTYNNDVIPASEKSVTSDGGEGFVRDFGPRPTATDYNNAISAQEKAFSDNFEPKPNISIYEE